MAAVVAVGFLGDFAAPLDTLAQFRAHASILLGLCGLALLAMREGSFGFGSLGLAAIGLYSVLPFMLPANGGGAAKAAPGTPRYTLLQMNLRYDSPDRSQALRLIETVKPDVVTAQEMTAAWRADFERLRSDYPYQFTCAEPFRYADTAILSRRPFDESRLTGRTLCDERERFSVKTVDFNGLSIAIGSEHLEWPWPWRQQRMLGSVEPTLAALRDPTIIAGDFNAAPWSAAVRGFAAASGTRVLAGIGPTWITDLLPASLARYAGLPIDNVLVSDGVDVLEVERLGAVGSDHLPVLVTFTMRFAVPDEPEVRSAGRRPD
ncbi:endonuclease/exonuclease/phosphatase family protein [Aureimonas leprariae]|uniref:AP endonuclease n=1 Tax=Plantimonas leprariae TaxID=2615207 RepID=A0A7V7TWK0_9HYPH|nr:endonuclease/exonuclease/phosphatase family protein [Aureimonas leprariae]KAB0679920.1 AP endonuclease [Aureimonas leprariae]